MEVKATDPKVTSQFNGPHTFFFFLKLSDVALHIGFTRLEK